MPLFLLVRHGENEFVKSGRLAGRQPGVHLNDTGLAQAQSLAERLKDIPVKALYSSPLERALETAQPLARALSLEIVQRTGLIETDCGEWQNKKVKELSRLKQWKIVQSAPSVFRFPGGESFRDAHARITADILDLAVLHDPKDIIVCVSHADPIKLAVAYFIGLPLDAFQRLVVSPGSVTVLSISEAGGRLIGLNITTEMMIPRF